MLKRLTDRPIRRIILSALAGTVLLAGCDQVGDRIDRAKEIAETSAGQISGETVVDQTARNLETASVEDRALAGTVMVEFVIDDEERPLFAIGSIIAKPKDIADTVSLAVTDTELTPEELEYFEEEYYYEEAAGTAAGDTPEAVSAPPAAAPEEATARAPAGEIMTVEQVMPKIKIDPRAINKTEREIAQATQDVDQMVVQEPTVARRLKRMTSEEFKALPVEEKAEMRKLARRAPVDRDAVKKQLDANGVMLETMSKYKIGGEVALSRQGQMVIQIGADGASPTQYRGAGTSAGDYLVRADQAECPAGMLPDQVGDDLALATACVVRDLRASGQFEYVEPDYIFQNQFVRRPKTTPAQPGTGTTTTGSAGTPPVTAAASFDPNDPLWALQWDLRDRGTTDGRSAGGAGFETFWKRQGTAGSRSVVVAVVDTGLQMSHPDMAGSPNIMAGWDMVSDPRMGNDGDGRDSDANDPGDMCDPTKPNAADSFHGTHVAGTVGAAGTNNGSGVAGGAWNVRIVPVRALGKCGGRLSDINDAIRWAAGIIPAEGADGMEVWNENPADVINLSIGLLGACPASLQDAIDAATEHGAIVVSAAGNARMSTSFYAPAGCRGVVTVAASDARGQLTPYSNYGPEVSLLAPGGDLTRDDNGDGKPDGVLSTKASANCYDPVTGESVANCFYAFEQGTSMAAPHVSAALALLKARSPSATKDELVSTLQSALDPRQALQCSGLCSQYPGTTPLPDNPDMCARPCGAGLLNLANIPAPQTGGGGR
ncbi:S8 family peptidase [Hyphomonas sp.]|uniref:S8 family peptidase n=1 Tax=Hyphomonas sp. TaxID=87 RepID=UPI00391D6962